MKIVIINYSDSRGGAAVVSLRLMEALRVAGHDARMLVAHRGTDNAFVAPAASGRRIRASFLREHLRIFTHNGFSRADLFKASIATDGVGLARHPWVAQADAVILGWVNQGLMSLAEIEHIARRKRTLWIMHDMWNATGVCHHAGGCPHFKEAGGCRRCPLLHTMASSHDLSHTTSMRKKALYDATDIRFVAVSSWLEKRCAESVLMKGRHVAVIPNAFPAENFYIGDKSGTPKTVLMGAARLDDPIKGLETAIEVFNTTGRADILPVFFGDIRNKEILNGLKVPYRYLGPVTDSAVLRRLYAEATAVISTSRYETLPGTLIEGMAAGCTPVAFDSGGQRDIITDGVTGYLISPYDTAAFAAALSRAVDRPFSPEALRESVVARFSAQAVAQKILQEIGAGC